MLVSSRSASSMGALSPHQLPADLSPRSSNSSMMSSNTSPSVSSPRVDEGSSPRSNSNSRDSISALQCLENALGRSPFTALFPGAEEEEEAMLSPKSEDGLRRSPVGIGMGSPTGSSGASGSTIFQCPLCHVVYNSRHDFNEHIVTHSQQHACPKCTFITNVEDDLHLHVQDVHGVQDFMDMLSDDEVKTPKTNAQGKLKTFKCKHCEYRAVTKKDFWDHTKSHIRQEKMLHCPKCPFITEYKHHLEYHLRNHMGSKPYQCTKCAYSCVNKSMLNSHLKSHSNIYQYRCSDCSYATKYCHSLKLHLRKYDHKPAMVLNPDGTPNPLPIIDVYGTRRGPKMKRPDPILEGLATTQPLLPTTPTSEAFSVSPKQQKAPKSKTTPVKKATLSHTLTPPLHKDSHSSGDSDGPDMGLHKRPPQTQLPQAPISPSSIALILQNGGDPSKEPINGNGNPLQLYNVAQYLLNPMFHLPSLHLDQKATLLAHLLQQKMSSNGDLQQGVGPTPTNASAMALDLRHPHPKVETLQRQKESAPAPKNKRKRKGKALRYDPKRPRSSSSDEDQEDVDAEEGTEEALDFSNNNNNNNIIDLKKRRHEVVVEDIGTGGNLNLSCPFCDISFFDRELYSIHMNFHEGPNNPFGCRVCGKRTQNKVEFFKHLTTDPH